MWVRSVTSLLSLPALGPSVRFTIGHRRRGLIATAVLLAIDALFAVLHALALLDVLPNVRFNLELDTSYAEGFQYLKLGACALALTVAFSRKGNYLRLGFAAIFAALLIEDALQIHEQVFSYGERLFHVGDTRMLAGKDSWELIYAVAVGVPLAILFGVVALSRRRGATFSTARYFFAGLAALAFFGVGVDAVHSAAQRNAVSRAVPALLGLVEDLGEMIAVSGLAGLAVGEAVRPKPRQ